MKTQRSRVPRPIRCATFPLLPESNAETAPESFILVSVWRGRVFYRLDVRRCDETDCRTACPMSDPALKWFVPTALAVGVTGLSLLLSNRGVVSRRNVLYGGVVLLAVSWLLIVGVLFAGSESWLARRCGLWSQLTTQWWPASVLDEPLSMAVFCIGGIGGLVAAATAVCVDGTRRRSLCLLALLTADAVLVAGSESGLSALLLLWAPVGTVVLALQFRSQFGKHDQPSGDAPGDDQRRDHLRRDLVLASLAAWTLATLLIAGGSVALRRPQGFPKFLGSDGRQIESETFRQEAFSPADYVAPSCFAVAILSVSAVLVSVLKAIRRCSVEAEFSEGGLSEDSPAGSR